MIIKETQLAVSEGKALNYAVGEIHMDDSKTKMKVYIRTEVNFERIAGVLKELYKKNEKYLALPGVPFTTKCYKKSKSFTFEKDIRTVLELLVCMSAMSKVTFNEAISELGNKSILNNRP